MQYLVLVPFLLVLAGFIYPPLGRVLLRNFKRNVEESRQQMQRRQGRRLPEPTRQETPHPVLPAEASVTPAAPAASAAPITPAQFGKKATIEEPKRAAPLFDQVFDKELFQGEVGDFLREAGFAPDDPRNQMANSEPLSVLLAEDQAQLRRVAKAGNAVLKEYQLEPWHLLPPALWNGRFGPWLRQALDLSPYRPWNTIFLPTNAAGATALDLPVAPPQSDEPTEQMLAMLEIIFETFAGKDPPEAAAVKIMLDGVRAKAPQLFPKEIADYSEAVRRARSDVRALAFSMAAIGEAVGKEAIVRSQQLFLGEPEKQLVS